MATSATPVSVLANSVAKDLGEQYRELFEARVQQVVDPRTDELLPILTTPRGVEVKSLKALLDEYLEAPTRRQGTATLRDRDSFVAHVNRFKDAHSAIFANPDPTAPTVTAVYDYHEAVAGTDEPAPRFGQHRAVYTCPVSTEWAAWAKVNGQSLSQAEFAAFLEDRIGDVIVPPSLDEDPDLRTLVEHVGARFAGPAALMALARGLQVNVDTTIKQAITLDTGEIAITYDEQHRDGFGAPVRIPNLFLIAVPVFYAGAVYRIPARLRYRVQQQRVIWSVHLYRADRAFEDAFEELLAAVGTSTALPVFRGAPEK